MSTETMHNLNGYEFTGFTHELEPMDSTHVHRIRRESNTTYRDEFAVAILKELNPLLWEQTLEGYSRSYYSMEAHLSSILKYGSPNTPNTALNCNVFEQAVNATRIGLCSLPLVRAINVLTELDSVRYNQSSAAGFDYIGMKGPPGESNHKRAISRAKATLWSAIALDGEGLDHVIRTQVPDVGYTRTQLTLLKEKFKVRGVWGRAFHYILMEGTSAQPLLDAFKRGQTFFHIGEDPTVSVPEILSFTAKHCGWLMSLDWSSFDATVSRFEINTAFDLIKDRITFPNFETEQAFEISRQLFIHKKIATPDGNIYWSHKGIPSGSYFTGIIGSIVNRLRVEYIWRLHKQRGPKIIFTQGDDSLIGDDDYTDPTMLAKLAKPLGWILNPDKTETSRMPEYVTFLGRTTYGGLNTRNLKKCIRLLAFPEFPVESGRISAFRAQSIAHDAGNTSQLLNDTARRLRRNYGVPSLDEVPHYFKPYLNFV
ncbi:ORF1 [Dactylorhiza cryptic virus 2]|nr:ORF1 [Dactylorhiza cryptic virus 2]